MIGTLTIIIAASFVLFLLGGKQEGPLTDENVKSIYVHYADGSELNVYPVSEEGEKIIAACNGVLNHMYAAIEGVISKEEFEEEKLTKTYAYLGLHGVQEVEIRGEYVPEGWKLECDGLYFIFGNFEHGWGSDEKSTFCRNPRGGILVAVRLELGARGSRFRFHFGIEENFLAAGLKPIHY